QFGATTSMSKADLHLNRRHMLASSAAALLAAPLTAGLSVTAAQAGATQLGPWQPRYGRYKLGSFEITVIADSETFIEGPYPLIGATATEDDVRRLMRDNLLP